MFWPLPASFAYSPQVLKGQLAFNSPNIDNNAGFVFLEERDEDEDDSAYARKLGWLSLPLSRLVGGGIVDGSVLSVADFAQDFTLSMTVRHRSAAQFDEQKHPQLFECVLQRDATDAIARAAAAADEAQAGGEAPSRAGTKRSREEARGDDDDDIVLLA